MNIMEHTPHSHILTLSLQGQNKVLGVGINSETANIRRDSCSYSSFNRQSFSDKNRRHKTPVMRSILQWSCQPIPQLPIVRSQAASEKEYHIYELTAGKSEGKHEDQTTWCGMKDFVTRVWAIFHAIASRTALRTVLSSEKNLFSNTSWFLLIQRLQRIHGYNGVAPTPTGGKETVLRQWESRSATKWILWTFGLNKHGTNSQTFTAKGQDRSTCNSVSLLPHHLQVGATAIPLVSKAEPIERALLFAFHMKCLIFGDVSTCHMHFFQLRSWASRSSLLSFAVA